MRQKEYIVKSGDTLASIARRFLGDWKLFGLVQAANKIPSPDHIRPGQKIIIPGSDDVHQMGYAAGISENILQIDRETLKLEPQEYFHGLFHKDLIALHFTAGSTAKSAYYTFAAKGHVATAYAVDRDGTVYELFNPKYWAYHLGRLPGDPSSHNSKRSIGIEIANVGPLALDRKDPNQLNRWPNNYGKKYCALADADSYIKATCKDKDYYATFTDEQYQSVAGLISYLCEKFNIPADTPDDHITADVKNYSNFKGILAHQHFRKDKYDMGPAFDWDRLYGQI
jgi:N-acetyl-anhydromuramyl-L-alanine amidase AmpD